MRFHSSFSCRLVPRIELKMVVGLITGTLFELAHTKLATAGRKTTELC